MKKISVLVLFGLLVFGQSVFANTVFDSYNEADVAEIQQIDISPDSSAKQSEIKSAVQSTSEQMGDIQNQNYRNAIQSLDAAQVEIREELIQYKQQYNEAKARYDVAKTECRELKKQINSIERKIKSIEKTKQNISKNIIEYL